MSKHFIERNEDGTPEDVFLPAKSFRAERLSDGHVWLSIETDTGELVMMDFTAKKTLKWNLEADDQRGREMSDDARALRARIDEAIALLRAQRAVIARQGWEDSSSETVLEVLEVLSEVGR